uniref:Uncharacterized protein n=1 Tax=Ditylenchus dipsaci TaxID=166011 RepID=A0A915E6I3_9BILA
MLSLLNSTNIYSDNKIPTLTICQALLPPTRLPNNQIVAILKNSAENCKRGKKSRRLNKNFLLGGSVTDPLNLKSLKPSDPCDEMTGVIEVIVPKMCMTSQSHGHANLKEKERKTGILSRGYIVSPVVPQKHFSDKSHKSKKQFNPRQESKFSLLDNHQDTVAYSSTSHDKKEGAVIKTDENTAAVRAHKYKQKNMLMRYRFGNFNNY